MTRRDFLTTASAAALVAMLPAAARAYDAIDYAPGVLEKHLAAGETVFLDFFAPWCVTCAAQTRVLEELFIENPAYRQQLTFIKVDWDTYKDQEIRARYEVPRRSTLIILKGDKELGRVVAGTAKVQIKGLLDSALRAATA